MIELDDKRHPAVKKAHDLYDDGENVRVDDDAEISECDDGSCWVQAWVHVDTLGAP